MQPWLWTEFIMESRWKRVLCPGKLWNLVFASPGKQYFTVCTNPVVGRWCWQNKATGQELFDKVCKILEENKELVMEETDYFCISYHDDNGIRVSRHLTYFKVFLLFLTDIQKIVPIGDWGHLLTLTLTSDDHESDIVVNDSSTLTNTTIWFVAGLSLIVDVCRVVKTAHFF